ncbi:MAG: transporter substrate-binding domain-containing protein [Oscillospiraceae bacterium]|nr:transporter substrate-binding domain-containing protein [Oscillospiraceae bacterium]
MKKFLALILAALMCITVFVACDAEKKGEEKPKVSVELKADEEVLKNADGDLKYILDKGELVVGITDFAPMDYEDENGNWIGFDADMAKVFASYLGVDVKFQVIDWKNKAFELSSNNIDVVWNGMTLTDEVLSLMNCSNAYCNNAQVVIVKKENANVEDISGFTFAVENGSAGMQAAEAEGFNYQPVDDQAKALLEVKSGTADAAIIDSLMAGAMVGEGTSFEDLIWTVALTEEKYGVGFRQESNVTELFNTFLKEAYDAGVVTEIAETYGVQAAIVAQ